MKEIFEDFVELLLVMLIIFLVLLFPILLFKAFIWVISL